MHYAQKAQRKTNHNVFLKLGITVFCTGNIMLLSFPEYFGLGHADTEFGTYFTWLKVKLALPVFFYGASDYLIAAYQSLRKKAISLDVPVSIGIIALLARSLYETMSETGPGYWDSLACLVFFLLIGKWLQNKTYENLSFDRSYTAYFPLAATVQRDDKHENIPVTELAVGDQIVIRNKELIPADSVLLSTEAWIDYSFVTGEAEETKQAA